MTEERLTDAFVLGGVITTVDIVSAESTLSRHEECVKQIAVADRIVLTKTDKCKNLPKLLAETEKSVSEYRAGAPLVLATSSRQNRGVTELRAELAKIALDEALQ